MLAGVAMGAVLAFVISRGGKGKGPEPKKVSETDDDIVILED